MGKYKICAYAICKNEEKFVKRWVESVSEADLLVVVDVGSIDDTVNKLRELGVLVYEEKITPWRFDTARNIALAKIPEDFDICVSSDMDEVFEQGWRNYLEKSWEKDTTIARYTFINDEGKDGKSFCMEKIHARLGYKWVRVVHETLVYDDPDKEKAIWVDGLVLRHYPDRTKPRSQYLPLMELAAVEDKEDDRIRFWLGREYYFYKQYDKAIETLKEHLKLKSATWDEERSASLRFIALSYEVLGNKDEARAYFYKSIAECLYVRETYLAFSKFGYKNKDWPLSYTMAKKGLEIKNKTGSYLTDTTAWGYSLYDLCSIAAYNLGLYREALELAKKATDIDKGNERLRNNYNIIAKKLEGMHEKV